MTDRRPLIAALLLFVLLAALAHAQPAATAAPSFETLAATYSYDQQMPLDAKWDTPLRADGQLCRVVFSSPNDQRVPAVVALPDSTRFGAAPYPAVVFGHGLGGSKDQPMYRMLINAIVQTGYGVIAIDYPFHGERAGPTPLQPPAPGQNLTPEQLQTLFDTLVKGTVQTVLDQRRAVDLLRSIPEVDPKRIGYMGLSLGAILGSVLSAVDDRIACSVLIVGGADWAQMLAKSDIPGLAPAREGGALNVKELAERLGPADPKNFASHIKCPVLLIFGGKDTTVPYDPCGKLLESLVQAPKTVKLYPESSHMLDGNNRMDALDALGQVNAFLKERLLAR